MSRLLPLGEVCRNASRAFDLKKPEAIFINTGDVLNGDFLHSDYSETRSMPGQAKKAILKDDILYSEIRPGNGRFAYVNFDAPDHVVSTKFMVIESFDRILPKYLYLILTSASVQNEFKLIAESRSGTFPQITFDAIAHVPIPVPEIEEQERIIDSYFGIHDKIALNRKLNVTLEGMARILFQSWFVDFDPVKAKLAAVLHGRDPERACMAALSGKLRIAPGKPKSDTLDDQLPTVEEIDAAIAELESLSPSQKETLAQTATHFPAAFKESELGLVPEGWEVAAINILCSLNEKSWTVKKHPQQVSYLDLANCKNGYILSVTEFDWDDAPSRARRVLKSGDTIVGTVRPGNRSFALIGNYQKQLTGSTGFAVLSPKEKSFREFIYLHTCGDENIARLTHLADGAAYPAVRPDVVSNFEIPLPPRDLLKAFSNVTAQCFDQRNNNETQSRTLAQLRDTLLPELLSGKLPLGELKAQTN